MIDPKASRDVAALLQRLPVGLVGADPSVEQLPARNKIYKISSASGVFVLRFRPRVPAFCDAAREVAFQTAAADKGLAPPVLYLSPEHNILVTAWVEGQPLAGIPDVPWRSIGSLAAALHDLEVAGLGPPVDPFAVIDDLRARTLDRKTEVFETLWRAFAEKRGWLERQWGHSFVVSHNDFSTANMLLTDTGPQLVDFEFAGPHDAWWDLAALPVLDAMRAADLAEVLRGAGLDPGTMDFKRFWALSALAALMVTFWSLAEDFETAALVKLACALLSGADKAEALPDCFAILKGSA